MFDSHDRPVAGHAGIKAMQSTLRSRYYWPTFYKDIEAYVKTCVICQEKWPEAVAVTSATAESVCDAFLDQIVYRHGIPNCVVSDQGSQFTSAVRKELKDKLGVATYFSSAYRPQSHGQVERFIRTFKDKLAAFTSPSQTDWDKFHYVILNQ